MNWQKLRWRFWEDLFHRPRLDRDFDEEIQAHIAIDTQRRVEDGEPPDIARTAALREVPSILAVKEATKDAWAWTQFERVARDIRHAARILTKNPVFALVIVLSLATGIGANAALFSLVDAMFLRTLPLEGADELVFFDWVKGPAVSEYSPKSPTLAVTENGNNYIDAATGEQVSTSFSYLTFQRFRAQSRTLSDVFAFLPQGAVTVNVEGYPDLIPGQFVSGNYFSALKVPFAIGRTMTDDDDRQGNPVAVISYRYWQRRFNLDPGVPGKSVVMNGVPLTIVGVTGPGFTGTQGFGSPTDISVPFGLEPRLMQGGSIISQPWVWWVRIMGRKAHSVSLQLVQAELEGTFHAAGLEGWRAAPAQAWGGNKPALPKLPKLQAHSGSRGLPDGFYKPSDFLVPLAAISAILLLIVGVNVANLLLARSSARQREIAVRLALGAGRVRVVRQILTEAVLLSLLGGIAGVGAAYWAKDLLVMLLPQFPTRSYDLTIDRGVLAFTALLSVFSGILFGLVPALRATREKTDPILKQAGRTTTGARTRLGKVLLVAQFALSLVLLIGAGLFLQTLRNLRNVDLGFNASNIILFRVNPGALKYDNAHIAVLYQKILDRTAVLPGVIRSTFSDYPLVSESGNSGRLIIDGKQISTNTSTFRVLRVHAGFLGVVGAPILAGRDLSSADAENDPGVAVVNEAFAHRFFPAGDAVGSRFGLGAPGADVEIVGIVRNVGMKPSRAAFPPTVYLPHLQSIPRYATFAIRTAANPSLLVPPLREAVRQIDSGLPMSNIKTQSEQIEQGFATESMFAMASTFFGGIALLLACIGLFGLMSYSVERQTQEIGLRMALGARRLDVVRLVMRQTLILVLIGVVLGIGAALALTRTVAALLFHVRPADPMIVALAVVTLVAVACTAASLPARRATRVDPTIALRQE